MTHLLYVAISGDMTRERAVDSPELTTLLSRELSERIFTLVKGGAR